MALIGTIKYLQIGSNTYEIPSGSTVSITRNLTTGTKSATINIDGTDYDIYSKSGTVTSVQVQATSPVQSSTSTAQSTTLSTTISLADAYGDTKNPYANKTANYVLAAPNGSAGAPTFRALVFADLPAAYWANLATTSAAAYNKAPEVASVKIGNGTTATATKAVTLQYNTTTEALDFIFM